MIDGVRRLIRSAWGRFDSDLSELIHGASRAFVVKVLAAAAAFGFNVLLARVLGADGAGVYFLALTVATVGVRLGSLGLNVSLLRFTASFSAIGKWEEVRGAYGLGMRLAALASLAASIVIFLIAPWLAADVFSKPGLTAPLRWMSLAVYPVVLGTLHAELLRGLKRIVSSQALLPLGLPLLAAPGVLLFGPRVGAVGAVWAYGLAALAVGGAGTVLWRRAAPKLGGVRGRFAISELLDSAIPALWISLLQFVVNWTSTLVLGVFASEADVGVYNAAARTAVLTSFILVAVNSIAAPQFAALYRRGQMRSLERTAQGATTLMILAATPILAAFLFIPGPILSVFGDEFRRGAVALSVLGAGQFVNVATGSVGYLLMMSGHERVMRNNLALAATLNAILNVALVPLLGVLGAAIATAIGLAVQNLFAMFLVYRRLGIVTLPRPGAPSLQNKKRRDKI